MYALVGLVWYDVLFPCVEIPGGGGSCVKESEKTDMYQHSFTTVIIPGRGRRQP